MSVYLKICGIRRPEDVEFLNAYPPDFAGFICSQPFWRYVDPEAFRLLAVGLRGEIARVGVFVDPSIGDISPYAPYLDVIQLHGSESAEMIASVRAHFPDVQIWKAARVRTPEDIAAADTTGADKLVLDSYSAQGVGGTGTLAPWELIAANRPKTEFLLAGGISPENAAEAIRIAAPWRVDASSSLETDRVKDRMKIRAMAEAVGNPLYLHTRKEG